MGHYNLLKRTGRINFRAMLFFDGNWHNLTFWKTVYQHTVENIKSKF